MEGCDNEEDTFETLERDFQGVLNELVEDKSRLEYERLLTALKKSHENEKRLTSKCLELNAEIVTESTKVEGAVTLSQKDQVKITSLKKELDMARKMIDTAKDKEQRAQETLQDLEEENKNLKSKLQEDKLKDVLKSNEALLAEREQLLTTNVTLREELTKTMTSLQEIQSGKDQIKDNLEQQLQVRQNEILRETRKREKLEKEVQQLQTEKEAKMAEISALAQQIQQDKEHQQKMELKLKDLRVLTERQAKEQAHGHHTYDKMQRECASATMALAQRTLEVQQIASELKIKEDEVKRLQQENGKLIKTRDNIQKRLHQGNEQKAEKEMQLEQLKNEIFDLEKDIEASKKHIEGVIKVKDELVRERDTLNKHVIQAADASEKQKDHFKLQEQLKKTLEMENYNYRIEAQKQRKIIYELEKERDHYIDETSKHMYKLQQHVNEIKMKEDEIFEFKKRIAEAEHSVKQWYQQHETAMKEKNNLDHDLSKAQDEMAQQKKKLKMLDDDINELQRTISDKESALVKKQHMIEQVERECKALKKEVQVMKLQAEEAKQRIDSQEAEERKHRKIIDDTDAELIRQKTQLDKVIHERDILGNNLLHRNKAMALMSEQAKIMESLLVKGNIQYNQRVEDIRLLKLEIRRLRREKATLNKNASKSEDLRLEVSYLKREVLETRNRIRILEDQQMKPMNIHHWRTIQATDPNKYELIQKIHCLQKLLITKTKEVVEKEGLLQEKEKLYVELKQIMQRQPGPEAAEELEKCKWTLRQKSDMLKVITAQMRMFESKVKETQEEIKYLKAELQDTKKEYFRLKHLSKEGKTTVTKLPDVQPQKQNQPSNRFTGGGFNLTFPALK